MAILGQLLERCRGAGMNLPYRRKETIGDCTLYLGDCLRVMPTLGKAEAVADYHHKPNGGAV